ncbi:MAG: hypothetical protein J7501_11245 [Bdellovibrio sp.]|nr:hypothetical protein [Bdellovibrio sp.]
MKTAAILLVTFMYSSAFASSSLLDKLGSILNSLLGNQAKQSSTNSSSNASSNSQNNKGGPSQQVDVRYQLGLLKKISCKYNGYGTNVTGPNLSSIDFPESPANTVCDPLSGSVSEQPSNGLIGKLILLSSGTDKVTSVMDYYNNGTRLDQKLYFADVNVPTRLFTEGFKNLAGEQLLDANGNKLVENFAIEYNSILKLGENDPEGIYEFALLSDDGARLFAKEGEAWKELVNNDGKHATRMGCSYNSLTLSKSSEVPIKLLYYQGPRYHVANVLMWRYHKNAKTLKSAAGRSLCGVSGNGIFYSSKSSKDTPAMKLLEATGWQVVANANYKMPEEKKNPCVEEQLAISNFTATSVSAPTATLAWTTNVASSSQLRITNFFTGEQILTPLSADLVTNHEVQIDGLIRGLYYVIEAISVDTKGNSVTSQQITITP